MQRSSSSATAQRKAPDPPARRHSPNLTRKTRSAQPQAVARRALLLCRMARTPRRRRLPHELDAHFYSVPQRSARSEVEVRLTPQTVEIFRGASGSRRIGDAAATMGTPPLPSTCRRATDVMPTGPSSAFVVLLLPSVQPSLLYAT